jgi:hypothetical protein
MTTPATREEVVEPVSAEYSLQSIIHWPEMTNAELVACARANVQALGPCSNLGDLLSDLLDRSQLAASFYKKELKT